MNRPPRIARARAFTLVEVMLAVGIFSMVMVAIFASWTAILRGTQAGQKAAAEVHRNHMSMSAVQSALFSVQMFAGSLQHYFFYADTSSDFAFLSLVSRLPASFPGSGLYGDQVVRRVTFSVEPGPDNKNHLILRQKPILEATNSVDDAYTLTLARDVSLFLLEFWDSRLNEWTAEWLSTNQLPKMVRVTLGIGNLGHRLTPQPEELVSRIVALPGAAVPIQQGPGMRPAPVAPIQGVPGPGGPAQRGRPGQPGFVPGGPGRAPPISPFPVPQRPPR